MPRVWHGLLISQGKVLMEQQGPGSEGGDARAGSTAPVRDRIVTSGLLPCVGRLAAAGECRQRPCGRQALLSLARTAASHQPRAYLAFLQDVPQQREVLGGEVPKRLDLSAVNEGYQVKVIQLQRDGGQ